MKLYAADRRKLSKELYPLTSVFHDYIPLNLVSEILSKYDIILLQEDHTEWSGFLCGRDSNTVFDLGRKSAKNSLGMYEPIKLCLYFSWYRHETNRYEINMYLC